MGYLVRQAIVAALTANSLRPSRSYRGGALSFLAGFLTTELAPQILAVNSMDTAVHLLRGRRSWPGLALAAFSTVGLAREVVQSNRSPQGFNDALSALGPLDGLEPITARDTTRTLGRRVNPLPRPDPGVRIVRDVRYSPAGRRGLLDLYLPAETPSTPAPVLLQIHGGGWTIGTKEHQGVPLMQHMASLGWICVAINYRLAPRDPFPAQIIDVKKAIAWIKEHVAEHGGDPDYVVVTGGSAGGHLAALAALTPGAPEYQPGFEEADTSVQAAAPIYGVFDFAGATGLRSAITMRDRFLGPRVLMRSYATDPEPFEAASPILRITEDAPDFFVVHGATDSLVDVQQARLFVEALRRESRAHVVYAELPGAQHAFDLFNTTRTSHMVRALANYLTWHRRRHVSGPAAVPDEPLGTMAE
ncbi:alpha/beta hydrolase [Nocardioides jishulii]|uniref:Alpha/beta hydrolase n=1 Tax=Nocardioides jishulii TaxID=2575440 RepID=A0A4U2YN66_9ACTN|nr:alpha/beta hydrolase [Nocardioides jishulii]QCX27467.1 alpha/beta hydrolase [Nocardioides jishulii]TKI62274.1 alpha/beta hydrolase [Nocardioides jishulii]